MFPYIKCWQSSISTENEPSYQHLIYNDENSPGSHAKCENRYKVYLLARSNLLLVSKTMSLINSSFSFRSITDACRLMSQACKSIIYSWKNSPHRSYHFYWTVFIRYIKLKRRYKDLFPLGRCFLLNLLNGFQILWNIFLSSIPVCLCRISEANTL